MKTGLVCIVSLWLSAGYGQARTDAYLAKLFRTNQHPIFQEVIRHPAQYRLQIIYTQINR
ncbi:MAG: hypothetical protein JWP57_3334, partial [Spirosoma sp.]|nr:hypothetical protein [Spirosoma sp.]